jgi:hypothetical protein
MFRGIGVRRIGEDPQRLKPGSSFMPFTAQLKALQNKSALYKGKRPTTNDQQLTYDPNIGMD